MTTNPLERALERADRITAANAELEALSAAAEPNQAGEVLEAARRRYATDAATHHRAELAIRVVERTVSVEPYTVPREVARDVAVVALELAERDRDTAEAKVRRVTALLNRALIRGVAVHPQDLAQAIAEHRPT